MPEDSTITVCTPFSDPDTGDSHTASICDGPENGTATVSIVGNDVCFTYDSDDDYNGLDSLCVSVCDAAGLCDSTTIVINVTPVNDAPIAMDDSETMPEDSTIIVDAVSYTHLTLPTTPYV